MTQIDVAVIGGGVTGLASAYFLAKRGASVCVLEGANAVGRARAPTTAA
jgi:glycine/D-amino acid oxidase-like deaminating enzyme